MVLTFTNPLTGELMHIPTAYPWPEDVQWINNMKEVTARDIQNADDLQQWLGKAIGNVEQWLARESACRAWTRIPYCPSNHRAYVDENAWDATRQKQNGYVMGLKLTDVEAARHPFSDFKRLIEVFSNLGVYRRVGLWFGVHRA